MRYLVFSTNFLIIWIQRNIVVTVSKHLLKLMLSTLNRAPWLVWRMWVLAWDQLSLRMEVLGCLDMEATSGTGAGWPVREKMPLPVTIGPSGSLGKGYLALFLPCPSCHLAPHRLNCYLMDPSSGVYFNLVIPDKGKHSLSYGEACTSAPSIRKAPALSGQKLKVHINATQMALRLSLSHLRH